MKKRIIASICLVALSLGSFVQPVIALENGTQAETVMDTTNEDSVLQPDSVLQSENEDGNSDVSEEMSVTLYEADIPVTVAEESNQPEVNVDVTEQGNGKFLLKITGVDQFSDVDKVYVPTWSLDNQQNICWYTADKQQDGSYEVNVNLANHQKLLGKYTSHIYLVRPDGSMTHVDSFEFYAELNSGWLETSFQNNNSSVRIDWKNLETQGIDKDVLFAVWGETNGQEDLQWYAANESADSYYTDVWLYDHNNIGNYTVHAYMQDLDGDMHHLASTYFYVESMPEETIFEITNIDDTKGTFDANLYINNTRMDVSKVYIPVWSESNQSDIVWYSADKTSNGNYKVTVDVDNHKCNTGTYHAHAYVQDSNGNQKIVGQTNIAMNLSVGEIMATDLGNYSTNITLDSVVTQGIEEEVTFAVWSAADGQDDISWYDASRRNDQYTVNISLYDHKGIGTYYIHTYLQDKNGKMHFLKAGQFNVDKVPTESKIEIIQENKQNGTFVVDIYLDYSQQSSSIVYVPIWSKPDQSDIRWYEANKVNNGHYSVLVDIENHDFNLGTYNIHLYTVNKQGQMNHIGTANHTVNLEVGEFYEQSINSTYATSLRLESVMGQGCIQKIYFAVWGMQDGQDDLIWYTATKDGNGYSTKVNYFEHDEIGTYQAHAYMVNNNGDMKLLKQITFEVDQLPEESLTLSNLDPNKGTFDIDVVVGRPSDTIECVYVPVWTKSDQSDLFWYTAKLQDDGSYKATIDAMDHYWKCGEYNVHSYIKLKNGPQQFFKAKSIDVQLGTKIVVEKANLCSYKVKLYGMTSDVTSMHLAAWTVENGQDDMVWYECEKDENGMWSGIVHSKNHPTVGDYECHIYDTSNGNVLFDKVTFNIEKKWGNEWVWIDGYKRFINENGDIDTDISRLVSGPYMIKVYKWSNYLIVFTRDERGNYTVPVKAMITSCGNATPVGTFYTPAKWRWCTMIKNSEAQWVTQVVGDYLLHSVPYDRRDPSTLRVTTMYNWLGTTQSSGCIRLTAGDAKWIYDNCGLGTRVVITASESGGPIAKPSFEPIPDWHTWDPTDPNMQHLCDQKGCH